jgi:hypothetical protein
VRSQEQRKPPHLETPSLCSSSTADASRDREAQILDTSDAGGRWHPQLAWVTLLSLKEKEQACRLPKARFDYHYDLEHEIAALR